MKKLFLSICTVALSIGCLTFAVNAAPKNTDISLKVDGQASSEYNIVWNEKQDRLLIDSAFFVKYFDAKVDTDASSATIYKNDHKLFFEKDNEFYIMDDLGGRKTDPLIIEGGKAYLPLRHMCEAMGATIQYDGEEQAVSIKTNAIVMSDDIKQYFENVEVFDQASIRITGEKKVYVDPRRILGEPHDADIILISHTHNDHYEIDTIKRVMNDSTVIYITEDGVEQAKADGLTNVIGVAPNNEYEEQGVKFKTVPAYNTTEGRQNHKEEFNWVGYIVNINGFKYYFAGDSDFIPDMNNMDKDIDVAFLAIDGKYNMDEKEAAMAANAIAPKVAVPYHYNNFVPEDKAIDFVELLNENIKGAILTLKMS